jgi:hypothetical protein
LYIARSVTLREDHVGAGVDARAGAVDRRVQAFDGERVGARHDDEVRVRFRVDGGLDPVHHLVLRHEFLAGRCPQRLAPTWSSMWMAAAPNLIIDFTVRATLNADAPKPVSTSTSSGKEHASVIRRTSVSTSSRLLIPSPERRASPRRRRRRTGRSP